MTQEHPITPPPELVQQWVNDFAPKGMMAIATQAARWGADQELEACCTHMNDWGNIHHSCGLDLSNFLRTARRPKPPSLKEQALEQLDGIAAVFRMSHGGDLVCDTIRRALEQLDD